MVHVYGHQKSGWLALNLTSIDYINLILDALAEHIMTAFLLSSSTRNTIAIGLLDLHGIPSVSIQGDPVHSNIAQYITYEIYKRWILQHYHNQNLTHMEDWDKIDVTSVKQARETTTVHMTHFITKYMSNTLATMTILQQRGHATTNHWPLYGVTLDMIQHLYQFTHEGSRGKWTASVDALRKWLKARNTDPYIAIIFYMLWKK